MQIIRKQLRGDIGIKKRLKTSIPTDSLIVGNKFQMIRCGQLYYGFIYQRDASFDADENIYFDLVLRFGVSERDYDCSVDAKRIDIHGEMADPDDAFTAEGISYFSIEGAKDAWQASGEAAIAAYKVGATKISFPGLNNSNSLSTSTMDLMRKYKDSKMSTQDQAFIKAGVMTRQSYLTDQGREDFVEWLFDDATVKQGTKDVKLRDLFFEQVVGPALSKEANND